MGEEGAVRGSCFCKKHSFHIESDKIRFGFASCHCSICRQTHGAPFVMWAGMNADFSTPDIFRVTSAPDSQLKGHRTSSSCTRFFCADCGTHLYIKYDDPSVCAERWAGEVYFPTALLDEKSLRRLEEVVRNNERPRYLHVFYSDRHACIGDLRQWADAVKYGGLTGLEAVDESS